MLIVQGKKKKKSSFRKWLLFKSTNLAEKKNSKGKCLHHF